MRGSVLPSWGGGGGAAEILFLRMASKCEERAWRPGSMFIDGERVSPTCLTNNSPTSVDIKVFSFCYIREQKRILYNLYDNILVGVLVNPLVHKSISLQFINHFYISFD